VHPLLPVVRPRDIRRAFKRLKRHNVVIPAIIFGIVRQLIPNFRNLTNSFMESVNVMMTQSDPVVRICINFKVSEPVYYGLARRSFPYYCTCNLAPFTGLFFKTTSYRSCVLDLLGFTFQGQNFLCVPDAPSALSSAHQLQPRWSHGHSGGISCSQEDIT
jgi:hypothetical protein